MIGPQVPGFFFPCNSENDVDGDLRRRSATGPIRRAIIWNRRERAKRIWFRAPLPEPAFRARCRAGARKRPCSNPLTMNVSPGPELRSRRTTTRVSRPPSSSSTTSSRCRPARRPQRWTCLRRIPTRPFRRVSVNSARTPHTCGTTGSEGGGGRSGDGPPPLWKFPPY